MDDFTSRLSRALEGISALNNLHIDALESENRFSAFRSSKLSTKKSEAVFCHGIIREITFDLYIPLRIQKKVAKSTVLSRTGTENFRVHIHYPYYGPVAYVQPIGTQSESPSTALMVVRKFLASVLSDQSNDLLFNFVGPSPFHANFQLEGHESKNESGDAFEVYIKKGRGYADVTFQFCLSEIDSEQALEKLFNALDRELGFFYDFKAADSYRHLRWRDIREKMSSLTEHFGKSGFLASLRLIGSTSRIIAELYASVTQLEINEISNERFVKDTYQSIYDQKDRTYLNEFIRSEIDKRPVFPTQQVTNLLSVFEGRRSKSVELLVFLAAAIIGGAVGSFITLLFGP